MDPADFYSGIVVDAYAALKSSTFDPEPYRAFVADTGEPALEVGCGDGEPLLDLCAAGLDVDGVDSSLDMVERCRTRAAERGLCSTVTHQRVEDLALERCYASIYLAGPTFTLLADDDTALRALVAMRDHLTDDGAALIPLWVPGPTPEDDLGRTRSAESSPGVEVRYTALSETYDAESRTRTTATRYERIDAGGSQLEHRDWVIHWQTPDSFRALCDRAGLEVERLEDDETGAEATGASSSFTAVVRRSAQAGAARGIGTAQRRRA